MPNVLGSFNMLMSIGICIFNPTYDANCNKHDHELDQNKDTFHAKTSLLDVESKEFGRIIDNTDLGHMTTPHKNISCAHFL